MTEIVLPNQAHGVGGTMVAGEHCLRYLSPQRGRHFGSISFFVSTEPAARAALWCRDDVYPPRGRPRHAIRGTPALQPELPPANKSSTPAQSYTRPAPPPDIRGSSPPLPRTRPGNTAPTHPAVSLDQSYPLLPADAVPRAPTTAGLSFPAPLSRARTIPL